MADAIYTHGHKRHTGDRRSDHVPALTIEEKERPVVVHPLPGGPLGPVAATKPVVYGCITREEWLPPWMGEEAYKALYELEALLGDAPTTSRSREAAMYFREQQAHALIARIKSKRLLNTLDTNQDKIQPVPEIPSPIEAKTADKPRDVQSVIAATAAALSTPRPEAKPHAVEVEEKITATKKARGTSNIDELIDDINDGLANFEKRQDDKERVQLIDGCYLKRNGIWTNLKHPKMLQSVVVRTELMGGEEPMVTVKRGEIHDWLIKVHNAPKLVSSSLQSLYNLTESAQGKTAKPAPHFNSIPNMSNMVTVEK